MTFGTTLVAFEMHVDLPEDGTSWCGSPHVTVFFETNRDTAPFNMLPQLTAESRHPLVRRYVTSVADIQTD